LSKVDAHSSVHELDKTWQVDRTCRANDRAEWVGHIDADHETLYNLNVF